MTTKTANILYVALVALFIMGLGTIIYRTFTLGSSADDYDIVCLDGHEYYRANFMAKGFLSIRLNDNGTPVNCIVR